MRRNFRRLSPPTTTAAAVRALSRTLRTDAWLRGRAVERFERKLASLAGVAPEQVVATASCTDALAAAGFVLQVTHYEENGELRPRVCPLTYAGTYSWVDGTQWVDCDDDGWPVAPVDVLVELWGRTQPGRQATIIDAAHRFRPIEAQAWLATGAKAVCWSFGAQKELPGVRGGAVVFSEGGSASAARAFLNNGIGDDGPRGWSPGRKGYMSNLEAQFLEFQLPYAETWRRNRGRVLEAYSRFFPSGSPVADLMTRPGEASGHLCVLRFPNHGQRELVRDRLSWKRIDCSVHYDVPPDAPPGCVALSRRVLSVPCHPSMAFHDVRRIANEIIRAT